MCSTVNFAWQLMANKVVPIAFYCLGLFLFVLIFFDVNFTVDALMSDSRESIYGKVLRLIVIDASSLHNSTYRCK